SPRRKMLARGGAAGVSASRADQVEVRQVASPEEGQASKHLTTMILLVPDHVPDDLLDSDRRGRIPGQRPPRLALLGGEREDQSHARLPQRQPRREDVVE